jgi:hypothetical protein
MYTRLFFIILLAVVSACDFDPTIEYRIDPRLTAYVDEFYSEATERGFTLRRERLTVSVSNVNGKFGLTYDGRDVVIDSDFVELYQAQGGYATEIEVIVFHELGHALLGRGHIDAVSIMNEQPCLNCYAGSNEERKEYLDELFQL